MRELKYVIGPSRDIADIDGGAELFTPCPIFPNIMIASMACNQCYNFVAENTDKQTVTCQYTKGGR
jgi:hypothetical protein